ncbi:MAG: hypothetical protein L3J42_00155 [Hydrogenimonas sp.]|nr:hypothetical protein [Hydrogenimonas sp.]
MRKRAYCIPLLPRKKVTHNTRGESYDDRSCNPIDRKYPAIHAKEAQKADRKA